MIILLLDFYFKINIWIYKRILKILIKKLLNLISFYPILLISREMKNWSFKLIEKKLIFLFTHFIFFYLNFQIKKWTFIPLIKLSKNILKLFFSFLSFPFRSPSQTLNVCTVAKFLPTVFARDMNKEDGGPHFTVILIPESHIPCSNLYLYSISVSYWFTRRTPIFYWSS